MAFALAGCGALLGIDDVPEPADAGPADGAATVSDSSLADADAAPARDSGALEAEADVRVSPPAADAGTDAEDSSRRETDAACTTTIGALSSVDAAALLLNGLDGVDGGAAANWYFYPTDDAGDTSAVLGTTADDGHTCAGAITFTATLPYGSATTHDPLFAYNYVTAADWSAYTKLHMWLKVVATSYSGLGAIQAFVESDDFSNFRSGGFAAITDPLGDGGHWTDGAWHEVVVSLNLEDAGPGAGGPFDPRMVSAFGAQTLSETDAGSSRIEVLLDDFWLE